MKKIGLVLAAVVLLTGFAGTSLAATSLLGTWSGTGSCATPTGFTSLSATVKVLNQSVAGLFRGNVTGKVGADAFAHGLTGYISGSQVRGNSYEGGGLAGLWEFTYAATVPPSLKGNVRGTDGTICSVTLRKK